MYFDTISELRPVQKCFLDPSLTSKRLLDLAIFGIFHMFLRRINQKERGHSIHQHIYTGKETQKWLALRSAFWVHLRQHVFSHSSVANLLVLHTSTVHSLDVISVTRACSFEFGDRLPVLSPFQCQLCCFFDGRAGLVSACATEHFISGIEFGALSF